ncbi:Phosphatidylinositol 4-phosphate 3-kinase C2 domain-containing subunit beta [Liparis tanakae]|uniref:Phosphatidylinositol 4-phosphate 3-kinase C2 domain-containing subunit beta n=1 Tax=Liparis tanakae TaxID=230148 RepID=A0A4Z2E6I0_9TELE|nr:Phosphatidylinositol 4-phosphate 3-kinase C2 domain-containing subunit beta [Liparis tanakae]
MSAVPTQKESVEPGWSGLEALGLSQKELVMAEALQMEYDALTRLRQDKSGPAEPWSPGGPGSTTGPPGSTGSTGSTGSRPPARSKTPNPTLNYDNINESLARLNGRRAPPRGRRADADQSGKPVARSKTLPPQVPPRTYVPVPKSNKNHRRVSADPVSLGSRINGFGYQLFQVSEERDEEVAAFCHMLDV